MVFSLQQGDLIGRSCLLFFQKRGYKSASSNLSNTTKFKLLDSLLQEVTAWEIKIANKRGGGAVEGIGGRGGGE